MLEKGGYETQLEYKNSLSQYLDQYIFTQARPYYLRDFNYMSKIRNIIKAKNIQRNHGRRSYYTP